MRVLRRFLARNWSILAVLAAWEAWVALAELNSIVLPGPMPVARDIVSNPGLYLANAGQTLFTAAAGLLIGFVLGILVAVLAWSSRLLSGMLTPIGLIFSSIPIVALIPIMARVLGYDISTVVAIVAVSAFFPTFVFTGAGLAELPKGAPDLFAVFGASRFQHFARLVLPSAVPNMMIAFRLIVPEAVLAAILAEFLMGRSGLGYLFREATGRFAMERALGTSLVAAVAAIICFFLAQRAERAIRARWS
ncbi:ABC transporter permease subunit [Martelella alba]|uniref:ABC transporter permease subunit n=1 Tax=Martelella alba TaxID=2590451 RepID=A0A506U6N6_9HYPH|nr:ABC transporter permease subunit [Martelella alba]TPW29168.1 ABC transporter permease subunit [Martelella alba]